MKRTMAIVVLAGLLPFLAGAQEEASALEISKRWGKYTIEAVNVPLGTVMERMGELSGSMVGVPSELGRKQVTLSLKGVRYEEVIEALVDSYALVYEKIDGQYQITSASLSDAFEQMLKEEQLSRSERRVQSEKQEEVKDVIKGITDLHGYAGQLDYDAAQALIREREARMEAYVGQLAGLGPGGARAVVDAYPSAGSMRERLALVRALGQMEDPEATAALGALFARAESYSMREEAVKSLNRRGDRAAKDVLVRIVSEEPDNRLRTKAVMGLSAHASALPFLAEVVTSENENSNVRCEAIQALGAMGGPGAEQAVARAAREATNPAVQKAASRQMERFAAGNRSAVAPVP